MSLTAGPLLAVRDLRVDFLTGDGVAHAVRGVDLTVSAGQTVALIGESGSGKTVTALAIAGILESPPALVTNGSILFLGVDLLGLSQRELRSRIQGEAIGMVFQDGLAALNPSFPIGWQIAENYRLKRGVGRREAERYAIELMRRVRIPDPERRADDYPFQFSGGMRQRAVIAMALALEPDLLIADEPTTALDVTIQAQILDLLRELVETSGMAMIFVSHDLSVVAGTADLVSIMYAGRVVEHGPVRQVFDRPFHPYTRALLDSAPRLDVRLPRMKALSGIPPAVTAEPSGCAFVARCPVAAPICASVVPQLREIAVGRLSACHFAERVSA